MVNSRSELKVTDFGIACTLLESMRGVSVRTSSGTLNYMSPQQMLGEDPSPSDDVYALGATLYEMLSSKPPFYGGDVASQVREVIAPTITQRRTKLEIFGEPIPKYWEETIAACLAKDPEYRPRTAAGVARRLRLGGTIRLAHVEENHPPLLWQHLRPHFPAIAGGALALVVAIATLFHQRPRPVAPATSATTPPALGYATEVISKPTAVPVRAVISPPAKLSVAPEPSPVSVSNPSAPALSASAQNGTLQLTTTPARRELRHLFGGDRRKNRARRSAVAQRDCARKRW